MHAAPPPRSFLDRWPARLLAVAIFVLAAGSIAWMHVADFFPAPRHAALVDPFAACMETREADLARMQREGSIGADQAETFRARMEGVCRAQIGAR